MIEEFDYQKSCRELLRIMQEKGLNLQDLLDMKYKKESEKIRAVGNLRITPYAEKLEKENKELKQQFASLQEKIELIVEEQVNICKERLKRMPDDEFYLGKIQGLRTAEDRLLTIFKEMGQ